MSRKPRAPRDEGLQQIDEWEEWFTRASLEVIASGDISDALRESETKRAREQAAAIANGLREELRIRQRQ